ncbi:MAG TPA: ligase-associated DNA damage response exonuclease [Planctomycetaceae bacterium]|nr:ligase-associated DNA damage response exonuclease [Planctomycetaceae bacterium]
MDELLQNTPSGLYCPAGDFYIDPHKPVRRALITHGHADHITWGCEKYLAAAAGEPIMRMRLQAGANLQLLQYREALKISGVTISFHPAGHILGSAMVRIEHRGRVALITGDYKIADDPTCAAWEPVQCHLMVTETTFGLPVYRWPDPAKVQQQINDWWRSAREQGKCALLYGYAIGKSQRLLAMLDPAIGPIYCHGAVHKGNEAYREAGIELPHAEYVAHTEKRDWAGALVLAVPSAHRTRWSKRFGASTTASASGWMAVRGVRRRRSVDRGFVISDHVDWPSLLDAVSACDPERIWTTHGYSDAVARYFREAGRDAQALDGYMRSDNDESPESWDGEGSAESRTSVSTDMSAEETAGSDAR